MKGLLLIYHKESVDVWCTSHSIRLYIWWIKWDQSVVLPTPGLTCSINTLKLHSWVKKLLGGWRKIRLLLICLSAGGSSFFFKYAIFVSIQIVFVPFSWPRKFFSSILGIKTSWRAIDFRLSTSHIYQHFFPPNWVILILQLKSTQNYWIKIKVLWSCLRRVNISICHGLVLWNVGNIVKVYFVFIRKVNGEKSGYFGLPTLLQITASHWVKLYLNFIVQNILFSYW